MLKIVIPSLIAIALLTFGGNWIGSIRRKLQVPIISHYNHVELRKDGVIFVSDGSKGYCREAVLELAKHGYHVVVGVKSDAEIRSFSFDQRKGLETIKFDFTNPSTFPDLITRLRQIRRDLDRPIIGLILNLADYIADYDEEDIVNHLDISYLDRYYKALFKGPVRLLQASFQLIKHQQALNQTQSLLEITAAVNSSLVIDTGALRIVTLYGSTVGESGKSCGAKCAVQSSFMQYIDDFASNTQEFSNFTVHKVSIPLTTYRSNQGSVDCNSSNYAGTCDASNFIDDKSGDNKGRSDIINPRSEKSYDDSILVKRMKQIEAFVTKNRIKWAVDLRDEAEFNNDTAEKYSHKLDTPTRAILHSFLSTHPLYDYKQ